MTTHAASDPNAIPRSPAVSSANGSASASRGPASASRGPASAPHGPGPLPPYETPLTDALQSRLGEVRKLLFELASHARLYFHARLDRAAFNVRKALVYAGLGLGAGIVGLAAVIYATILTLSGISTAVGLIFGRPWLGALLTGLLVLGVSAFAVYYILSSLAGKTRRQLRDKYEAFKQEQRQSFGHDLDTAATKP